MSSIKTELPVDEAELNKSITDLVEHLKNNPQETTASFEAESILKNGFQSKINVRDFTFVSDEPEEFGGTDSGPSPVEYVLGALTACQEIVVKTHAALLDINVQAVETKVEGSLDLEGFLNLGEERAGFKNVKFHTTIQTNEQDSDKLDRLKSLTLNRCPVLDIIQNSVPVEDNVSFVN